MGDPGVEPERRGPADGVAGSSPGADRAESKGETLARWARVFGPAYWGVTLLLVVAGLVLVAAYTPVEAQMGAVQKIFYFHLPVAMTMFVPCFVVFAASAVYLWHRSAWCDDLAHAAGEVAVLYSSVVLATGMIWAREAWGQWWTWSPRLTLSLVLWLLYVAYLVVRPMIGSPQKRAVVCAVYGVMAFLDVPLVYFSVRLMPDDIHPARVEVAPEMLRTVLFWIVPVGMACVGFVGVRYRLLRASGSGA